MNEGFILVGTEKDDEFDEVLVYDSKKNLIVDSFKFDDQKVRCSSSQTNNGCSTFLFKGQKEERVVRYRHHVNKKTVQNSDSIR